MTNRMFSDVLDKDLRDKLERVSREHEIEKAGKTAAPSGPIRFAFSRATPGREIGSPVRVRCALDDEPRGGTIRERIGRAYMVEIDGRMLAVYEPDDCWE
jgi:hypothetical protein